MPEESLFADEQWFGVVQSAYLRVYSEMGNTGEVVATLRKGDLVQINEIRLFYHKDKRLWSNFYRISSGSSGELGWADSEQLTLYNYAVTAEQESESERNPLL